MADESRELARFTANLTYEQIPTRVRRLAVDSLIDQIGCQIGCSELPWAKQVWQSYCRSGGTPEATVVKYGDRLPLAAAAFVNSTFGHSFEFDDAHTFARGHPGAALIPPLLAVGERDHVSGSDFLTAFIAAYEVCCRIGWAVLPDMSEHGGPSTVMTCGPFGAAAGVAKLLRLEVDGIHNAIGIAGAYAGGLQQYDHGGGSVKRIICAIAASNGISAALLAHAGVTGPEGILEGDRGVLKIYSRTYRPELLVVDLGKKWMIDGVLFKPHSSCGAIHAAIEALKSLADTNKLEADSINAIEVGYPKVNVDHVAITSPHDLIGMQFSTSYSLALTVLKGANTPREYTMDALEDPAIRAFASKVHVVEDIELTKLRVGLPARVKVWTNSGQIFEKCVLDPKGSATSPFSSEEIDEKFTSQVADLFGSESCQDLLLGLRTIDGLDDIAKLSHRLVTRN